MLHSQVSRVPEFLNVVTRQFSDASFRNFLDSRKILHNLRNITANWKHWEVHESRSSKLNRSQLIAVTLWAQQRLIFRWIHTNARGVLLRFVSSENTPVPWLVTFRGSPGLAFVRSAPFWRRSVYRAPRNLSGARLESLIRVTTGLYTWPARLMTRLTRRCVNTGIWPRFRTRCLIINAATL